MGFADGRIGTGRHLEVDEGVAGQRIADAQRKDPTDVRGVHVRAFAGSPKAEAIRGRGILIRWDGLRQDHGPAIIDVKGRRAAERDRMIGVECRRQVDCVILAGQEPAVAEIYGGLAVRDDVRIMHVKRPARFIRTPGRVVRRLSGPGPAGDTEEGCSGGARRPVLPVGHARSRMTVFKTAVGHQVRPGIVRRTDKVEARLGRRIGSSKAGDEGEDQAIGTIHNSLFRLIVVYSHGTTRLRLPQVQGVDLFCNIRPGRWQALLRDCSNSRYTDLTSAVSIG